MVVEVSGLDYGEIEACLKLIEGPRPHVSHGLTKQGIQQLLEKVSQHGFAATQPGLKLMLDSAFRRLATRRHCDELLDEERGSSYLDRLRAKYEVLPSHEVLRLLYGFNRFIKVWGVEETVRLLEAWNQEYDPRRYRTFEEG